ncbi:MAG: response regulator [Syntrophales bacterium]
MRVLFAEDNELNQRVILAMLKHLGYRADTVLNGIDVLIAIKHKRYDLILMNVGLPLMDGLEATRQIRKLFRIGPKIIAVTAYAFPDMRQKCLEAGMDGFIIKPVRLDELCAALRNQLSHLAHENVAKDAGVIVDRISVPF